MPTPVLTWAFSGLAAKTGTTPATLFADVVAAFNAHAGDSAFAWQVASSQFVSTPYSIVLKPKSGAAGRILLVLWTAVPAGNNPALLEGAPSANALYGAFFPAGHVDSPSNLTAASGTVMGDDTGSSRVWSTLAVSTVYAAGNQFFYFDAADGVVFGWGSPTTPTATYMSGAGGLVVNAADTSVIPGVFSLGTNNTTALGAANAMPWTASAPLAGAGGPCARVNLGGSARLLYQAYQYSPWANQPVGSGDVLSDTLTAKRWYAPIALISNVKGEGPAYQLRQIGVGSGSTGAFDAHIRAGTSAVAARQFNPCTIGANGAPWMLNFAV